MRGLHVYKRPAQYGLIPVPDAFALVLGTVLAQEFAHERTAARGAKSLINMNLQI